MNTHSLRIFHRRPTIVTKAKSNDKYERILEAAIKVFAEQGFHQATISQIAREAGVADGTIYLYFKNKDDIMVRFFDQRTKRAFSRFRVAVDRVGNARDKLTVLIRTHLEEFQLNRDMAVVYQAETHRNNRSCEQQIRDMSKMYLDIVSEIVEQGQQEGLMRKDLYLGLVKRFIIGAVDEVINTWLHSNTDYDLSSMAEPLVDLFLRGVGNPEEDEGDKDA
ncbi:MAG: TetR/AcrR family transcriptional regulator [Desulfobacterales bacterium]|nr:TetR/AcrR family transcriptional regulator [Desulfobacterales bacterium]